MKHEAFKNFIKTKPELIKYVQSGEMTWQKFYELYDIYGEDESVWNKYILNNDRAAVDSISKITDMVKNVNVDSIKSHINTAQKAIDFIGEDKCKEVTNMGLSENATIPVYDFSITNYEDNTINISVSKKGGHIVNMNTNRDVSVEIISQEEANSKGKEFLSSKGLRASSKSIGLN